MAEVPGAVLPKKEDTDAVLLDFDNTVQFGDKSELTLRLIAIAEALHSDFTEAEIREFGNRSDFREMRSLMIAEHNRRFSSKPITDDMFLEQNSIFEGMFDYIFTLDDYVIEALHKIRESRQKTGIVTTRATGSTNRLIVHHGLDELLDTVVGRDDVKERKPNPESLILAMSRLILKNFGRVVYIGDSQEDDIGAGNAAGMMTVLIGDTPPDPKGPIPTYQMESLEPLVRIYGR